MKNTTEEYYVHWIEYNNKDKQHMETAVCCMSINQSYLTYADAKAEAIAIKENYKNNCYGTKLIALYIERWKNGRRINIPFHETYVTALGLRKK